MIILASLIIAVPKPMVDNRFLDALAKVEYGGRGEAPDGDGGNAVGPYQIWPIYMREANRILRAPVFGLDDRRSYKASREMTRTVLSHWAKYHKRKGVKITPQVLCSLHRHPNHRWTPAFMNLPIERVRSRKLLEYMRDHSE